MAVNPVAPTTREPFAPGALYEIKVDTNGDAIADVCYSVQFAASEDGTQTATLRRVQGARATAECANGEVIVEGVPVSIGPKALVTEAGDYRLFFGWRSDPFFFDANGLFNQMQFTGEDFFADQDVCSIVLELPNSALGADEVGLWACTLDNAVNDRMLPPEYEQAIAKHIHARTTILTAGHVPMLSMPNKVAAVIIDAANNTGRH